MSDYLVTPIKGHWKNWQKLAQHSGVAFSEKDRKIGEAIFNHKPNKFPVARPRIVEVHEYFSPSDPSTFDNLLSEDIPAHPVVLLTLMSGIGNQEETGHLPWTYRKIASTLLLAHPSGQVYTFLIDGGEGLNPKWEGRFLPAGEGIGRSMYIQQYSDKKGFDLPGYFVPNEKGKYGRFAKWFELEKLF